MSFVGVQDEGIPVLTPKFLAREISHRFHDFVQRRPRRHREHEPMDELRRLPASRGVEGGLPPDVINIEIPIAVEWS